MHRVLDRAGGAVLVRLFGLTTVEEVARKSFR